MEDMALRESPVRTLACLTANRANTQRYSGPFRAASKARVALNALQHGGRIDPASAGKARPGRATGRARPCFSVSLENVYRWFSGEITANSGMGRPCPIPNGTRAGRSDSHRGVAPGPRLGALTSKGGMSFSFMGIMLATIRGMEATTWYLGARLGALTNKAGMSFSFMGIMLATARAVKDSDGGLEATAGWYLSRLKQSRRRNSKSRARRRAQRAVVR